MNLSNTKHTFFTTAVIAALLSTIGCGEAAETTNNEADVTDMSADGTPDEMDVVIEETIWVIDEHQLNDIAVINKPEAKPKAAATEEPASNEEEMEVIEEEQDMITADELGAALADQELAPVEVVDVSIEVIEFDEEQSLTSYGKHGEELADLHVLSDPETGEIHQIIFTDKKHKDVYDVQAGMTGKEVKQLRKELKHMEHKGQYYLYDDTSNIMYLMTATDTEGDEMTEMDIETMEVTAIIWKDKKHHKKHKDAE